MLCKVQRKCVEIGEIYTEDVRCANGTLLQVIEKDGDIFWFQKQFVFVINAVQRETLMIQNTRLLKSTK